MPKSKKNKRQKIKDVSQLSGLSNLTGFGDAGGASLDDCMAEMMFQGQSDLQSQQHDSNSTPVPATESDCIQNQNDEDDQTTRQLGRGKLRQPSWIHQANKNQTSCRNMMSTEDIENWNRNFQTWAKGGLYTPGLLPNID